MRVRPKVANDEPALAKILAACRADFDWVEDAAVSVDRFRAETDGEVVFVADDDGEVVGFVSVWQPESFVHHLYVEPSHQRRGIGAQLLAGLSDWLLPPYRLKCVAANTAALAFYAAQGWRQVDRGDDGEGPYLVLERR